ncbi:MAG TPA: hypothetical protein V6C78_01720 [Crinalium sp.]|jgi:hypothetical protein
MFASIKTLLTSVVDYAGLFPPASLNLVESIENYKQSEETAYRWMLGSFVLPETRLTEFEALISNHSQRDAKPYSLSVIVSKDLGLEPERIYDRIFSSRSVFSGESSSIHDVVIVALEFPHLLPTEIGNLLPHLPVGMDTFFEVPVDADLQPYFEVLQNTGAFIKVRTGGITASAFPDANQLSQFMVNCAHVRVPFKATAGLHHPLRGIYPVTYNPGSPSTTMHGFLNLTVAAALAYGQKATVDDLAELLQDQAIAHFQFTSDSLSWKEYHLTLDEISKTRREFFHSFGSCSFTEPIDGLKELSLIEE